MGERLVIVGNGMAAARFVEELSARALGRYAIAVIGEEPTLAYNRVLLSSLLAGEIEPKEVALRDDRWWRSRGVTLRYGAAATAIDTRLRRVKLADGAEIGFDRLVLATGSRAIRLDVPGAHLPGVMNFRDIADVRRISDSADTGCDAVVIGGGLLGIEAATGLATRGAKVTLIHLMDRLMERQLDAQAAAMLKSAVESKGVTVLLGAQTAAFEGGTRAGGVRLRDGRVLAASLVVVAVGVRPNTELAQVAGLNVRRGIVVDDSLATSAPNIFAIGECAEHRGQCYGLVEPAYDHARVLAQRLAGGDALYEGSVLATNLKLSGVPVFSAGDFLRADAEAITLIEPAAKIYKKLVIADGRLVGAVLFGDTADGLWYQSLIQSGEDIAPIRGDLAFGRAFAQPIAA